MKNYDVAVCGGGIAGISAALVTIAKRHAISVISIATTMIFLFINFSLTSTRP